jgi:hypothetical protein
MVEVDGFHDNNDGGAKMTQETREQLLKRLLKKRYRRDLRDYPTVDVTPVFEEGLDAGRASRDAEVEELRAVIEELELFLREKPFSERTARESWFLKIIEDSLAPYQRSPQ